MDAGDNDRGDAAPEVMGTGAGPLIAGRYRLVKKLGQGGMGTVWLARDEVVRRDVALKEPQIPLSFTETERQEFLDRTLREAQSLASVTHPNVVTLYDVLTERDQPWLVMELVRGRALADLLKEGTLHPAHAARTGMAVLDALTAIHQAGVLHRDVTPANVLLAEDGRVLLTDLGIAQIEGTSPLTQSGAIVGSPEYIAPERVSGLRPGPAADFWSLGVLLFVALEGWSPFRRSQVISTMLAAREEPSPPPVRSGSLAPLITALLAKDPADRPGPDHIRGALSEATGAAVTSGQGEVPLPGGRAAAATAGPARPRSGFRTARGRVLTATAAVVLVAGLVLGVIVIGNSGNDAKGGDRKNGANGGKHGSEPTYQWTTIHRNEVQVSLHVPKGYTAGTPDDAQNPAVRFQEPGFAAEKPPRKLRFQIQVFRNPSTDDRTPAEGSDNDFRYGYLADGNRIRSCAREDHLTFAGWPAATLDTQYYAKGDAAAGSLHRVIQLKVIDRGTVEYSIYVRARGPEKDVHGNAPAGFYNRVVAGLRLGGMGKQVPDPTAPSAGKPGCG